MMPDELPERIAVRIEVCPASDCWQWAGAINEAGYGTIFWCGHKARAHRAVYHLLVDPTLPVSPGGAHVGLQLDHTCENRRCVNPSHLEPVTHAENHRRRAERHPRPAELPAGDPRHGTLNGYGHWRCRCPECRFASLSYWRAHHQRPPLPMGSAA